VVDEPVWGCVRLCVRARGGGGLFLRLNVCISACIYASTCVPMCVCVCVCVCVCSCMHVRLALWVHSTEVTSLISSQVVLTASNWGKRKAITYETKLCPNATHKLLTLLNKLKAPSAFSIRVDQEECCYKNAETLPCQESISYLAILLFN